MGELANCLKCGVVFVRNQLRNVCPNCWKEEEQAYDEVYQYIRKRENRTATMEQVVEATGVNEELIFKFIRSGRLLLAHFPNLGYPCEKCGTMIREGKLCVTCAKELKNDLANLYEEEKRKKELSNRSKAKTYLTMERKNS
ncbi:TIGR03826 family flagellar region protein [Bacillus sp. 03113]|uniref:TIGR03826 family flagellar region protein n=1 Tax=Bacillus sp. 03113 TaxID=2578211 RepID=UPI0011425E9E|nr:TIGR03826 family flagellar region protein [Bacillus sp. 03113]